MMGDRDYRQMIKSAIDAMGRELETKVDPSDAGTMHLFEVVRCLRRSYYDRTDPKPQVMGGFNELTSGLLRKLHYGAEAGEFDLDGLVLKGQADMIVDDAIIIFRSIDAAPSEPSSRDVLYLNALFWMYEKFDGIIVYIMGDRSEVSFSLTRNKKMFEETSRRVRVLADLLAEKKTPILEPSGDCARCQYYERCFMPRKHSKQISLADLVGLKKE